ncbi:VC0807 family protein [Amycolatopsis pigmentata]|uniref:VC0807 family protein n=1 Tax=Amycolatopsis pigmentata TaxID=450801 RepID=A0ABW5G2C7_9PSEU
MNSKIRTITPVLLDLVLPIGGYFLLHGIGGLSDFWALTIAGSATGAYAAINTARRGKLDVLGLLVVLEVALSIGLLFTTRDPRIVLLKPSLYIAVAGGYTLVTCFIGRPLCYESGKPFVTKGDPDRLRAYELSWHRSDRFRRALRVVTAFWGVAFLADAVVRVVVVYSLTPERVSASVMLSTVPLVVLVLAALVGTRLLMRPLRPVIEQHHQELVSARQPG